MKGTIEQVWENETRGGKKYHTIQVDGERYNVWDDKYASFLQQGEGIEYDFRQSGDYKHITDMKLSGNGQEPNNQNNSYRPNNGPHNGKDRQIARMSCLKSASEIMAPVQLEPDAKRNKVIDTAKYFERYVFEGDPGTLPDDNDIDQQAPNGG